MDTEADRLRRGLRHYFQAAGKVLREKPHRNSRFMARQARQRARLGLEALDRGDMPEASKLYERALEAHALAAQMLTHGRLAPDAKIGRRVADGGRKGQKTAYGTAEEKDARRLAYKVDFESAREGGMRIEAALNYVARRHGCSTRTIRRALKEKT